MGKPIAGTAMMGGDKDHDDAFGWLCQKAVGGDSEAVFIVGGNQARYVNSWRGTRVQGAINANIAGGKPIGGPAPVWRFWASLRMAL